MAIRDPRDFNGRELYSRRTVPVTDRRDYEDLLGKQSIMGGDTESEAIYNDMMQGTGQQYAPGGIEQPEMFPGTNPIQDYIQMLLARQGRR